MSTLMSEPQSTSTTARKTSPALPLRRWTTTSPAVILPREEDRAVDDALNVDRTGLGGVDGAVGETSFHADDPDDDKSART